jgi:uncharacterized protein YkwD
MQADILYYINEHRLSKGLVPLNMNQVLTAEAQKHSQQMASGRVALGHSGFSNRVERISTELGPISQSGENVASGNLSAQQVVANWLNSTGHRENIEGRFTLTGIGIAKNNKGVIYFTQIFIRK